MNNLNNPSKIISKKIYIYIWLWLLMATIFIPVFGIKRIGTYWKRLFNYMPSIYSIQCTVVKYTNTYFLYSFIHLIMSVRVLWYAIMSSLCQFFVKRKLSLRNNRRRTIIMHISFSAPTIIIHIIEMSWTKREQNSDGTEESWFSM